LRIETRRVLQEQAETLMLQPTKLLAVHNSSVTPIFEFLRVARAKLSQQGLQINTPLSGASPNQNVEKLMVPAAMARKNPTSLFEHPKMRM
jgi:hypothetical protein